MTRFLQYKASFSFSQFEKRKQKLKKESLFPRVFGERCGSPSKGSFCLSLCLVRGQKNLSSEEAKQIAQFPKKNETKEPSLGKCLSGVYLESRPPRREKRSKKD